MVHVLRTSSTTAYLNLGPGRYTGTRTQQKAPGHLQLQRCHGTGTGGTNPPASRGAVARAAAEASPRLSELEHVLKIVRILIVLLHKAR